MSIPVPSASIKSRLRTGTKKSSSDVQINSSEVPTQDENAKDELNEATVFVDRPTLGRNMSSQSDVPSNKRRSFLPQPGRSRYNTRSSLLPGVHQSSNDDKPSSQDPTGPSAPLDSVPATATATTTQQGSAKDRPRPKSMYQIDTARIGRTEPRDDSSTSRLVRPGSLVSKPAEPRTAGLVRSQSLRRQGATIPAAAPRGASAQAQTQPVKINSVARKDTSNSGTTSESSKSLLVPSSQSSQGSGIPTTAAPNATRTSARLPGSTRSAGAKARNEVTSTSVSTGIAAGTAHAVSSFAKRQEHLREDAKKTTRPAFSTLQQHFTPRKVGKASTATFLHPQPVSGASSLPSEILSLQAQLLQLHLWHANSSQVSRDWEASAKKSLHKKFEEVSRLHQTMLEYEAAGHEEKTLQSLLEWNGDRASSGLIEHIQILSEVMHELPSLVEPDGRLQRLVQEFEDWISKVQEARSARQDSARLKGSLEPVEGLGDSWKAENAALLRKLTAYSHDLTKLDQPPPGSSIASVVETCKTLLEGVLDELHIMQTIEKKVVVEEKQWVEDRVNVIAKDQGAYALESGVDVALWRS